MSRFKTSGAGEQGREWSYGQTEEQRREGIPLEKRPLLKVTECPVTPLELNVCSHQSAQRTSDSSWSPDDSADQPMWDKVIEKARQEKRELSVAWIDFRKAYQCLVYGSGIQASSGSFCHDFLLWGH